MWQCHQLLSGSLANGQLSRVSCQSCNKCGNEMMPGDVLRSPAIYHIAEEISGKSQLGNRRWRLFDQLSPQMGSLTSKWGQVDRTARRDGWRKEMIRWVIVNNYLFNYIKKYFHRPEVLHKKENRLPTQKMSYRFREYQTSYQLRRICIFKSHVLNTNRKVGLVKHRFNFMIFHRHPI